MASSLPRYDRPFSRYRRGKAGMIFTVSLSLFLSRIRAFRSDMRSLTYLNRAGHWQTPSQHFLPHYYYDVRDSRGKKQVTVLPWNSLIQQTLGLGHASIRTAVSPERIEISKRDKTHLQADESHRFSGATQNCDRRIPEEDFWAWMLEYREIGFHSTVYCIAL